MSAWIVSRAHIDALVAGLAANGIVDGSADMDAVGRELWRENYRSVNFRYGEHQRTPSYTYSRPRDVGDSPCWLEKLVACYDYQSCERPDWAKSKAFRWTKALYEKLAANRPCGTQHISYSSRDMATGEVTPANSCPSYDNAPWGL